MRQLLAALSLLILHPAFLQDKRPKGPLKFPLAKASFKKGAMRLGYGLQGTAPETGWRATVAKDVLLFFDLDGNGQLEPDKDGLALHPYPFVVLIPSELLLKIGQFNVAFDGTKALHLTQQDLGPAQKWVEDAATITELRIRAGVRPAPFDGPASADCDKHCDYLKANGLTTVASLSAGISPHDEQAEKPGYTAEGAAAGKYSAIDMGTALTGLKMHIERCHAQAWHSGIVDPRNTQFSGTYRHGVSMVYKLKRDGKMDTVFLQPADGEIGVPLAFAKGEMPNPVPGTQNGAGCGFPIRVRLVPPYNDLISAQVTDAAGRALSGTSSSPAKPATPQWPTNSGCALFIPSKPLAPNSLYRVQFKFAEARDPIIWSFTTGN